MNATVRYSLVAALVAGCADRPEAAITIAADPPAPVPRRDEPPVPLNSTSPVLYPEAPLNQRLGGTVVLRLFIDTAGVVARESTEVQESSGYPALDSAALAGVPRLRYAPALRAGSPVATRFLQPITFRAPSSAGGADPP